MKTDIIRIKKISKLKMDYINNAYTKNTPLMYELLPVCRISSKRINSRLRKIGDDIDDYLCKNNKNQICIEIVSINPLYNSYKKFAMVLYDMKYSSIIHQYIFDFNDLCETYYCDLSEIYQDTIDYIQGYSRISDFIGIECKNKYFPKLYTDFCIEDFSKIYTENTVSYINNKKGLSIVLNFGSILDPSYKIIDDGLLVNTGMHLSIYSNDKIINRWSSKSFRIKCSKEYIKKDFPILNDEIIDMISDYRKGEFVRLTSAIEKFIRDEGLL